MVNNTVQTLIDYTKDLTGLTNLSNEKVIRALNFGVDSLSTLSTLASGRNGNDSRNHGDVARVITTVASGDTKVLLENEVISLKQMDILVEGRYIRLEPVDRRDMGREPLDNMGTGLPRYYDREGNHAYLYPRPDASYTLRLTYGRLHPRFTTDNLTQATGMLPLHEEYVALFASDRLMIGTNDPSVTSIRDRLALSRQDVINIFKNQDEDRPARIKPKMSGVFTRSFNNK